MTARIIVLNAGSSSLKFSAFDIRHNRLVQQLTGNIEELYGAAHLRVADNEGQQIDEHRWTQPPGHDGAIAFLFDWLPQHGTGAQVVGVGHRVVHGGETYSEPVRITEPVMQTLTALIPLVPLHQPHNLKAIRALSAAQPALPQVACFDTAFHSTQPPLARQTGLPRAYTDEGVRNYGFHGLSYEYIASVLPEIDPHAAIGRTIVLHLGNGASLCAMQNRRSIATTMGFSSLSGPPMGTRCGDLDPGVLLYLMEKHGMDRPALEQLLYKQSGLLGLSGISSDMRLLLQSDAPAAREAIELFCYRIGREIGSQAAALGGIDALVFTAGIGEHAAPVRAAICRYTTWLGAELDNAANQRSDHCISTADSRVKVWVIPTNEELMIARHTQRLLGL